MKIVLNDFIGVRGRSGSSRGANLIAEVAKHEAGNVSVLRPAGEPRGRLFRLCNMLAWDFLIVPLRARSQNADVLIHATNTGAGFGKTRSVVVVHDTMVLDHPQLFNRFFVAYARVCISFSVKRADLVVTPSNHSKRRIEARWPGARVKVIPWPAYSDSINEKHVGTPLPNRPESLDILVVSSMDKHKRLPLAIQAVQAARSESGRNFRLIFVTRQGNDSQAFDASRIQADPEHQWIVIRTGIDDSELSTLYRRSFCVLVPSLDEGFCLPALEGCVSGVPVVHANRGALPEVIPRAGAQRVNPEEDLVDLKMQLLELLDDNHWRTTRDAAREHAARFTKSEFASNWTSALSMLGFDK
ncbi:glycosyltransferase [Arthrobacter sp. NQ4]|uniref:glycosyltransferase n=1 Tax=Arthrobacter sp. NQ4 TaxID=3027930 RepID=UPI0023AE9DE0|nr:glycosyltransferase [Arthrobacter sp. NQ4]MDE8585926.1 glycosyltransferase [Arthrobacter sp. NQ4]